MNLIIKSGKYLFRSSVNYEKAIYPTFIRYFASDWKDEELDLTLIEETPKYLDVLTNEKKEEIFNKRNKSGLQYYDRNRVHGMRPYNEDYEWYHNTIRYKRRIFGRYGMKALNMPVGALWLKKEEIDDKIDYEKTAYPHTLQECWKILAEKKKEEDETIRKREQEIEEKLKKVSFWEQELRNKVSKKEETLRAAQEKKNRLVEDVRRQLGYEIDPRDNRFKEALEKKELEEKKRRKEAKKQEKSDRIMAQLLEQSQTVTTILEKKAEKTETPTSTESK